MICDWCGKESKYGWSMILDDYVTEEDKHERLCIDCASLVNQLGLAIKFEDDLVISICGNNEDGE